MYIFKSFFQILFHSIINLLTADSLQYMCLVVSIYRHPTKLNSFEEKCLFISTTSCYFLISSIQNRSNYSRQNFLHNQHKGELTAGFIFPFQARSTSCWWSKMSNYVQSSFFIINSLNFFFLPSRFDAVANLQVGRWPIRNTFHIYFCKSNR